MSYLATKRSILEPTWITVWIRVFLNDCLPVMDRGSHESFVPLAEVCRV